MNGPEHYAEAERLLDLQAPDAELRALVHATLAQAAATERVAQAIENLPTYEGMLAVYAFGVNSR